METTMHNLISFNQLAGSKHTFDPQNDKIADYYECIVECEEDQHIIVECEDDQHICKRMCKEILL